MKEPKWLEVARTHVGVKEFAGNADNPVIVKFFSLAGLRGAPFTDDETPWCAAFVGACLAVAGLTGTGSAAARSYEAWTGGVKMKSAKLGAIAVLNRQPPKPGLGHVGFVVGADAHWIDLLGGNQSDMVCVRRFPIARVICFQWPKEEPIAADWINPPLGKVVGLGSSVV